MTTLSKDQKEDLAFLKRENWPYWPLCCLKKHTATGGMPLAGSVFSSTLLKRPVVHQISIWELSVAGNYQKEALAAAKKHEYESVEAMLLDGWQVD